MNQSSMEGTPPATFVVADQENGSQLPSDALQLSPTQKLKSLDKKK